MLDSGRESSTSGSHLGSSALRVSHSNQGNRNRPIPLHSAPTVGSQPAVLPAAKNQPAFPTALLHAGECGQTEKEGDGRQWGSLERSCQKAALKNEQLISAVKTDSGRTQLDFKLLIFFFFFTSEPKGFCRR